MATGGMFLSRKLEQLLPGVLETRFRSLLFENGTIVPTLADLEAGTAEVVRETMSQVGDAEILGDGAIDIPLVDISADEDRYKVVMVAAAFSYTFQQERAFEKAGVSPTNQKMATTRRVIAEKMNRIAAFGDTRLAMTGFLNNANVTLNNSSFDPYNVGTTADGLIAFFLDELEGVVTASNNTEYPSNIVCSTELEFKLIKTRVPDGSMNCKEYILSNSSYITSISGVQECRSARLEAAGVQAGGTNKDRIVLYAKDPMVVERHIELPSLMPPEYQQVGNGRRVFPMFACTTSTIVNFPGAMKYIDVPKRA